MEWPRNRQSGFNSSHAQEIFSSHSVEIDYGAIQLPLQWVPGCAGGDSCRQSLNLSFAHTHIHTHHSTSSAILNNEVKVTVNIDGQSVSLLWCQALICGPRPNILYCQAVAGVLMWDTFSDERTCLSFVTAAGSRQRGHSRF
jgi:hypothetical protein